MFWVLGKIPSQWEYLTSLATGNMPAVKKTDRILSFVLPKVTNVHVSMKFEDPKVMKTGFHRVFMKRYNLINTL